MKSDALEQQWNDAFELLTAFHERELHCDVPFKHEEAGVRLGAWLGGQRIAHGKGTLNAARLVRLETLGVVSDVLEKQWDGAFELLVAFRERELHCDVPSRHEEAGVRLEAWLGGQRIAHGKGTLDAARRARLETLGVVWDVPEKQWDDAFELPATTILRTQCRTTARRTPSSARTSPRRA